VGRPSNSDERRNQILTAFMKAIAKKGYSGASIQEIAAEADMTPGLIHYHFKSKQEILMTLFARLESLVKERFLARIEQTGKELSPIMRLHSLIEAFLEVDQKSDELAVSSWTMISAEAITNTELKRAYREVVEKQLAELEEAIKVTLPSKRASQKTREIASATLAAIHGSFLLALTTPGLIPKGSAAKSVKDMVDGMLASVR